MGPRTAVGRGNGHRGRGAGSKPRGSLAAGPGGRLARSRSPRWRPRAQSAFVPPARPVRAGWSRPRPGRRSHASARSINPASPALPGAPFPKDSRLPKGLPDPRVRRFPPAASKSMAAIPSSGSLVATHDYYRRRLGSTSSNSSSGSAEYPGEAIPHPPGLPKADPGHWWASFFFGKSTVPFMATVLESPEHSQSLQASSSIITCDLAREATRKQPGGQPSKASAGPPS